MLTLNKLKKQATRTFNREDRQKVYQSAKWKKLRLAKLLSTPLCELCLAKGIITPAINVHHIDRFMNYTGTNRLSKAYDTRILYLYIKNVTLSHIIDYLTIFRFNPRIRNNFYTFFFNSCYIKILYLIC